MLRRSISPAIPLTASVATSFRASSSASHNLSEYTVGSTSTPAKVAHTRSEFQYEGSGKAKEVGARNEAAFVDYQPHTPSMSAEPNVAFGMPNMINLLTVAPINLAMTFAGAFFWGVAMWRFYASRNYASVAIARP